MPSGCSLIDEAVCFSCLKLFPANSNPKDMLRLSIDTTSISLTPLCNILLSVIPSVDDNFSQTSLICRTCFRLLDAVDQLQTQLDKSKRRVQKVFSDGRRNYRDRLTNLCIASVVDTELSLDYGLGKVNDHRSSSPSDNQTMARDHTPPLSDRTKNILVGDAPSFPNTECPQCELEFTSVIALSRHLKSVHSCSNTAETARNAQVSDGGLTSSCELEASCISSSLCGKLNFKCDIKGARSDSASAQVRLDSDLPNVLANCSLCKQSFSSKSSRRWHELNFHQLKVLTGQPVSGDNDSANFQSYCDEKSGSSSLADDLLVPSSISVQSHSQPTSLWQCKECSRRFPSRAGYFRHSIYHTKIKSENRSVHGGEKSLKPCGSIPKCKHCSATFAFSTNLFRHLRLVHPKESFSKREATHAENTALLSELSKDGMCRVCGKAFKSTIGLKQHLFRHKDKFKFSCHICHRGFHSNRPFTLHLKKCENSPSTLNGQRGHHEREKRTFLCDACSLDGAESVSALIFESSPKLKAHMINEHDRFRNTDNEIQVVADVHISSSSQSHGNELLRNETETTAKYALDSTDISDKSSSEKLTLQLSEKPVEETVSANFSCAQQTDIPNSTRNADLIFGAGNVLTPSASIESTNTALPQSISTNSVIDYEDENRLMIDESCLLSAVPSSIDSLFNIDPNTDHVADESSLIGTETSTINEEGSLMLSEILSSLKEIPEPLLVSPLETPRSVSNASSISQVSCVVFDGGIWKLRR